MSSGFNVPRKSHPQSSVGMLQPVLSSEIAARIAGLKGAPAVYLRTIAGDQSADDPAMTGTVLAPPTISSFEERRAKREERRAKQRAKNLIRAGKMHRARLAFRGFDPTRTCLFRGGGPFTFPPGSTLSLACPCC
jgi:hypothetical protein